jgi:hypothetical protein
MILMIGQDSVMPFMLCHPVRVRICTIHPHGARRRFAALHPSQCPLQLVAPPPVFKQDYLRGATL